MLLTSDIILCLFVIIKRKTKKKLGVIKMQERKYPMTDEGKEKLEKELNTLKTEKRKEVVERIKVARGFGDLSENSEYDAAREEQAFIEGRIQKV